MSGDRDEERLRDLAGRLEGIERQLARQNRLLLAIGLALTDDTIDSDLILRAEQRRLLDEGKGGG
jgi:hypothetical protein